MEESRIQDIPNAERPREKLARFGPASLDNAELMALFLRTGIQGRSAIQIGRDLLKKHGSMGALGKLSVASLSKEKGLGLAKASQLIAAFELGARVAREQVVDTQLDTPELIYDFLAPQIAHHSQEQVLVILLDPRLRHTHTVTVSIGSVSEALAHPREILRPVITHGAYGFILSHNHPSGDPTPSAADERITRRVAEAADLMQVRFLDHLIVGRPMAGRRPYFSFRESGLIK